MNRFLAVMLDHFGPSGKAERWPPRHHGFRWGYTWTKTYLQGRGLLARAPRRGPIAASGRAGR